MIEPGSKLGRYTITRLIGSGGLSEVYHATDSDLGRSVGIKIPRDFDYDAQELENAVLNEARILAQVPHSSIVSVFDIGYYRDKPYSVLEYLEKSLHDELKQSGRLPAKQAANIIIKIADAMDFVHRRGFLHRNLKPTVILLDSVGQPKLLGFELAIAKDTLSLAEMAGTPQYMAPEQFTSKNSELGEHTDVWGLGVTFYQILTGQMPFNSRGGFQKLVELVTTVTPIPPREINPSIPNELERICLKCLSKVVGDRYSSAEQLAVDLRVWQQSGTQPVSPRVFISHATKDRMFVEREIISLLEEQGIKTWYSKADIQTASEWERSIRNGLESCEWFILAMSPNAALSEWVKDEVYWAVENRPHKILPVLIADCDPVQFHIRLARIQHVDFRSDLRVARQSLLGALQNDAET